MSVDFNLSSQYTSKAALAGDALMDFHQAASEFIHSFMPDSWHDAYHLCGPVYMAT